MPSPVLIEDNFDNIRGLGTGNNAGKMTIVPDPADSGRQPLLPNRLSRYGPALAIGDIDGDGDKDGYICR